MKKKLSPYLIIILSFILLILIGSLLLLLPFSVKSGYKLGFDDALFLSASSVTITGLSTISNLAIVLTPFGKIVLTILIKIGGLSVITLSVFIMLLIGAKIGISNRILLKENLGQLNLKGVVKLVKWIILTSFIIELFGSIINFIVFIQIYSFKEAIAISIIQSIVAFNNSGFDLMGVNHLLFDNVYPLFTINTMLLVILGGIGFIVILDIINKKSFKKLSLHTKIVLKVNLFLWILGLVLFKINSNLTIFQSLFLSVNARSAGFGFNQTLLPNHGLLILFVLMIIGASPASTGSGMKTTTFYVLIKSLTSFARGTETTSHKRLISVETKQKAYILLTLISLIIITSSVLLSMFENINLQTSLQETIAALSNSGISSGYATNYSLLTKLLIIVLMFIGRVGLLTIIALFNPNWYKPVSSNVTYIEEKIIVG